MAAVDSLLRMIATRNAESLSIVADGIPELRRGGVPAPLSMPPLSSAIVGSFLVEIGGASVSTYQAGDGSHYAVAVDEIGAALRITFTPTSTSTATPAEVRSTPKVAPMQVGAVDLASLLSLAEARGASDILLSSDVDAWLRIEGAMRPVANTAMSGAQILEALGVKAEALDDAGSIDFAMESGGRYRVNVFRQSKGIAAALRPIRNQPPSLEALNLPSTLRELAEFRNGLVLIAGTAGSGKSTTLAALIEHLNASHQKHIITLEDPIEYRYQNKRSLVHQREIGAQVADFPTGLRSALRESPDVLLVGEMRDRETIAAAITAAETGHLVLGTIHASCAMVAIDRVIDIFPEGQQRQIRYQLATILRATLTQMLVPSHLPPGRMPAIELMRSSPAISANIREDKTYQLQSAIQTGRKQGMITLEMSLAQLVRSGKVHCSEAEPFARDKTLFAELMSSA